MPDPNEHHPWVVRADFSDNLTWERIRELLLAPQKDPLSEMEFTANLQFVEDPSFEGISCQDLVRKLPAEYVGFFTFVVDSATNRNEEHSLLVIGFAPQSIDPAEYDRPPSETPQDQIKSFRALPSTIQAIENNLSLANMDFEDFANAVGPDGVFRGFSR